MVRIYALNEAKHPPKPLERDPQTLRSAFRMFLENCMTSPNRRPTPRNVSGTSKEPTLQQMTVEASYKTTILYIGSSDIFCSNLREGKP